MFSYENFTLFVTKQRLCLANVTVAWSLAVDLKLLRPNTDGGCNIGHKFIKLLLVDLENSALMHVRVSRHYDLAN